MSELRTILLAEDDPKDIELTLEALSEYNLANQVAVVRDGVEAMEYLRCQGKYRLRKPGNPAVLLLDIRCREWTVSKSFRQFVAILHSRHYR